MRMPLPARALALAVAASLAFGCVSVRPTGRRTIGGPTGGISVRVYADDDGRRSGRLAPSRVLAEVDHRQGGAWQPVFRSLSASWTLAGLPPGEYRVRFPVRLDEAGNVVELDGGAQKVRVESGQIVQLETTLSHVSPALIAAGVITAVAAAVLLDDWLDDHDLPMPPLPPPEVVDAVAFVTLDFVFSPGGAWQLNDRSPAVTSHFPAEGELVEARRIRVIFALSEPLDPDELDANAVAVLAEGGGLVSGTTRYDAERWWVVWEPTDNLPADDVLHVTLAAEAIADRGGNELPFPSSFSFRTAE